MAVVAATASSLPYTVHRGPVTPDCLVYLDDIDFAHLFTSELTHVPQEPKKQRLPWFSSHFHLFVGTATLTLFITAAAAFLTGWEDFHHVLA